MFNKITSAIIEKMYGVKNKLLLINITLLFAISIDAYSVPLLELDVADTININNLKELSTEIIGNVFDGYKLSDLIETNDFTDNYRVSVNKKACMSFGSLASYYHLELSINDTEADPLKIFETSDQQKSNYFHASQNYFGNKYLYGIVKLCRILKVRNLKEEVIDESDFPTINRYMNYKLLLDKTAILRFKRNNETHFVSSITTGDCLLQVRNC